MKTKKVNFEQQCNIVEKYIIHNTNEKKMPINYKMTSQTWANVISKWAGVEISTKAINLIMFDLQIESKELAQGSDIFVFACAISKQL